MIVEDSVVVDLADGRAKIAGKVPAGYVYVDGTTVGGAAEGSLKDRRTLSEAGVVTVVALVDADTGELAEPPDFLARGFVHDDTTFEPVIPAIEKALAKAAQEGIGDVHQLEQLITRVVGVWAWRTHRRKSMIIPVIIDV